MAGGGRKAYLKERIPTAQHFDIDEVADKSSPYPHMLPSEREFEGHVGKVRGKREEGREGGRDRNEGGREGGRETREEWRERGRERNKGGMEGRSSREGGEGGGVSVCYVSQDCTSL